MSQLNLEQVSICYDGQAVVHDVSLTVRDNQIGCLLGPSGCGKTTLLRTIAGFEPVSCGRIALDDQVISAPDKHLSPEKRQIGMVFQDYALFPHMNVGDNISFGIRKQPAALRYQRVQELLELVNLPGYAKRYPHELSGGQQQRIALARALAARPRLLLLDEPFGSQDIELREKLAREVREIILREEITALLVTHDQHEAFAMADEIGVMRAGYLLQWDRGYYIYHKPANSFIASFVGQGTLIPGRVIDGHSVSTVLGVITGEVPVDCGPDESVEVLIRPDDIQLVANSKRHATVVSRLFRGAQYLYKLAVGGEQHVFSLVSSHQVYEPGEKVCFELDMKHLVILKQGPFA